MLLVGSKIETKLNIPWSRQKTPLEAHLGHIFGPCCAKLGPKLAQVGSKLGKVGAKLGQVVANMGQVGAKCGPKCAGWMQMEGKRAKLGPSDRKNLWKNFLEQAAGVDPQGYWF